MQIPDLSLDHAALVIRDLAAARQAFERLGFCLSSRSMHAGALTPGGPVVPWGSGNHCAMFRNGYFELLGLVDASLHSTAKKMLEKYEGLHIVAMDCPSADQAYAQLQAAQVAAPAPLTLERDAPFGPHDDQVRRARFRNINLDVQAYPEARFIVIEHGTRDVLWQPHLLQHPNGANALAAMYFCSDDVPASLARFEPILGKPTRHGDAYRFALKHGAFWFMDAQAMRDYCPVLDDAVHRVSAACIAVDSLESLHAYLSARGIETHQGPTLDTGAPSLWVHPSQAGQGALQFIQSK